MGVTVFCPALVLPACAAALARPTRDAAPVEELTLLIEKFPNLHLVPLDLSLARRAGHIAKAHYLRGSDSVYVARADTFDATLVRRSETLHTCSGGNSADHTPSWALSLLLYSGDRDEPPHVHVEREGNKAKFWLDPVRLQSNRGFRRRQLNRIQKLIEENRERLLKGWDEFFSG